MEKVMVHLSPNRVLTLNDLHTTLFSYLIAKKKKASLILVIEDANQENYSLENEQKIYDLLKQFKLSYESCYIESEHLQTYLDYAEKLLKKQKAYYCFCSKESLNHQRMEAREKKVSVLEEECVSFPKDEALRKVSLKEKYTIRANFDHEGQTSFYDEVYKDVTIPNHSMDNSILIKSNHIPTFFFASLIDAIELNSTTIIRKNTFLTSTPKDIALLNHLNAFIPSFLHLPSLIQKESISVEDLLKQGFLPEAILNYLYSVGYQAKKNQELFTLEEMEEEFEIEQIRKKNSIFSLKKLIWFNKQYIKKMDNQLYLTLAYPYIEDYNILHKEELLLSLKPRISFLEEIPFFLVNTLLKNEEVDSLLTKEERKVIKKNLEQIENWTRENILSCLKEMDRKMLFALRLCITGRTKGLNLSLLFYYLGKEEVLKRLEEDQNETI